MERRIALKRIGLGLGSLPFLGFHQSISELPFWNDLNGIDQVENEAFWREFAKEFYDVSNAFINLENGYFGIQPIPVANAYRDNISLVNRNSSRYMRTQYGNDYREIMQTLADFSGAETSELLLTRNATEALNILIQGYPWEVGDEVLLQHHDYHSMIETFQMVEQRRGIKLKFLEVPLTPDNQQEVIDLYVNAITGQTRCILLTHLTHLTGQIIPVREIAAAARKRGVDVIVDAAHSFAQLDYKIPDLGAEFVGVNLHKWFSNPLGAGLMYIKKDRIPEIQALYGDVSQKNDNIYKLGHFGTPAAPVVLTIPAAAEFNNRIGIALKEKRLRYLQNYWTSRASKINRVSVTTPLNVNQSCALASFKMDGVSAAEVVDRLNREYQVFTVIRKLHQDKVVRVTPNLYNSTSDLDRLLEGISGIAQG